MFNITYDRHAAARLSACRSIFGHICSCGGQIALWNEGNFIKSQCNLCFATSKAAPSAVASASSMSKHLPVISVPSRQPMHIDTSPFDATSERAGL